jgi:hypothetical protein
MFAGVVVKFRFEMRYSWFGARRIVLRNDCIEGFECSCSCSDDDTTGDTQGGLNIRDSSVEEIIMTKLYEP